MTFKTLTIDMQATAGVNQPEGSTDLLYISRGGSQRQRQAGLAYVPSQPRVKYWFLLRPHMPTPPGWRAFEMFA